MPSWTQDQAEAIEATNHDTLVSASAGSGKSTVLIAHVMRLLREGGDITRLLIITFTRAAAAELREKMERELSKEAGSNAHLRKQLRALKRAQICTLHVFCSHVLRTYFQVCGIDPNARVGEDAQLIPLRQRAMAEALEEMYASEDPDAVSLQEKYGDAEIESMVDTLNAFLGNLADPEEWIAEHVPDENGVDLHPYNLVMRKEALLQLEGALAYIEQCEKVIQLEPVLAPYQEYVEKDYDKIEKGMAAVRNKQIPDLKLDTLRVRTKEPIDPVIKKKYTELRDEAKEVIKDAVKYLAYNEEESVQMIRQTLPSIRTLIRTVQSFQEKYSRYKAEKNLFDFNDLEHKCIQTLQDEGVRRQISDDYDAIFVDEYQDVSGIQEQIVRTVHSEKNTLFMVGDVKQSIYRFRQADPSLFLGKYEAFSKEADGSERKINLSQNFRSRKNILDAVNCVFSKAMRKTKQIEGEISATELDYDEDAYLKTFRSSNGDPAVQVHIIEEPKKEKQDEPREEENTELEQLKGIQLQAQQAARTIGSLICTEITEGGVTRKLTYKDIVILMRSARGKSEKVAEVLKNEGIGCYSDATGGFYEQAEVEDMVNILRVLDNPYQDIPLMSTLRCPCIGFSSERLAAIKAMGEGEKFFYKIFFSLREKEKDIAEACEKIENWRFLSGIMTVDELLRYLIRETGIYAMAGALKNGTLRQANLRLLCERAQADGARFSLRDFLSTSDIARHGEDKTTAKELSENDDVVRIMTIHKSKGLEFPVVIVMGLSDDFPKGDQPKILTDKHLGLAVEWVDTEKMIKKNTLAWKAVDKRKERENRAEEARLLYVAMTRAKDRLILMAGHKDLVAAQRRWQLPPGDYASACAKNMMEWIGQAIEPGLARGVDNLYTAENGSEWDIRFHMNTDYKQLPEDDGKFVLPVLCNDFNEEFGQRMHRTQKPHQPQKTSVTQMTHHLTPDPESPETAETKRHPVQTSPALPDRPAFMQEKKGLSAAERGTACHKVLGMMILENVKNIQDVDPRDRVLCVEKELDRMKGEGILTDEEYKVVKAEDIAGFLLSDLGQRMLRSPHIQREWGFYMMPEVTIIQGVIDLCFIEDGQWVLCDYKTDRCEGEELVKRYSGQLIWYAKALEEITGTPVKEIWIYGLHKGVSMPVKA